MKKFLALFLAAVLVCSTAVMFAGCGGKTESSSAASDSKTSDSKSSESTAAKGELHMDGARLTIITQDGARLEDFSVTAGVGKNYWGAGHDQLIADFYRHLSLGQPPFVTSKDALETIRD